MDKQYVYFTICDEFGLLSQAKELRPTGLWEERTTHFGTTEMYVQHKGLIFKHWIHEDSIVYSKVPLGNRIFKCNIDKQ